MMYVFKLYDVIILQIGVFDWIDVVAELTLPVILRSDIRLVS
jgi:hypothetical protein